MKRIQNGCIIISISVIKYHLGVLFCIEGCDVLASLITEMKHTLFYITIEKIQGVS
jgi:hypothetical protein